MAKNRAANRQNEEPFVPAEEQMKLWPKVSGNTINGLGETEVRPPTPIYWHPEGKSPFFKLQEWMMAQGVKEPAIFGKRAERAKIMGREPVPIAPLRSEDPPESNVPFVKQLATSLGAKMVGVIAPRKEWIFDGYSFDYPWIILLGITMDYEKLSTAPEVPAALTVVDGYMSGWKIAQQLADGIRDKGWRAEARGGPPAGPVLLVPAAIACGFGELGKHGSIISRELGSNFRLAAVFTDMPLIEDTARDIGAEDFCLNCQVCVNACPVDAISNDKQMVRGIEKWYVDFDRCLPYFNETFGCAICIAACPWSAPHRGELISTKMLSRREAHRDKDGLNG
jgi:ferredoxin